MTSDDLFTISVPTEDLEAPKGGGGAMQAGKYRTTLQPGTTIIEGKNGWKALQLPISGFEGLEGSTATLAFPNRSIEAKFTIAHDSSADAVRIGRNAVIGAASAFGLTTEVVGDDGKPALKLTATSNEELVEQFNAMAGTVVGVYVTTKNSKNLKNDGTPFVNNEIARFFAL